MGIETKTIIETTITDDLDNKKLEGDPEQYRVIFGWGGRRREIYLSDAHREQFEKAISKFVDASKDITTLGSGASSTRRRSARSTGGSGRPSEQLAAIREWAKAHNIKDRNTGKSVSERGRISGDILEQFDSQ